MTLNESHTRKNILDYLTQKIGVTCNTAHGDPLAHCDAVLPNSPLVKQSGAVMFSGKNIYDNDQFINIYGFVILHVRDLFEKDFRKF